MLMRGTFFASPLDLRGAARRRQYGPTRKRSGLRTWGLLVAAMPLFANIRTKRICVHVRFWPGAGTAIIEIGTTLPTPNLPKSTSGMERPIWNALQPPSVLTCPLMHTLE